MKRRLSAAGLAAALLLFCASCAPGDPAPDGTPEEGQPGVRALELSDEAVTLDGAALTEGEDGAVTVTHDIVYYRDGTDDTYGEGTQADMHSAREADAHTVVTIREAGTYQVSGTLSAGQLAVDLGSEAKRDPEAVVTLILDGVDITCTVAPAVIFYNVYECDTAWVAFDKEETEDYASSPIVDTSRAGANVVLADGSENHVSGSYVARIYREGTTKKLHKYDGAFYSKMSMNISGEAEGTGVLSIIAENEGLDSELHLTVNGGVIRIEAQNDGINTNEDGVSVTTINGGSLHINAGLGEEGDGIDSNGHIVINGGTVYSMASDRSPDGGLDADGEILLHGGTVAALGVRNDTVSADSRQLYMELSFASPLSPGDTVAVEGTSLSFLLEKGAQSLILSSPELQPDVDYTLTVNGAVQQYTGHGGGFPGGPMNFPGGELPVEEGARPPEGQEHPQPPEGDPSSFPPEGQEPPDGRPHAPDSQWLEAPGEDAEPSAAFTLTDGVRTFSHVSPQEG